MFYDSTICCIVFDLDDTLYLELDYVRSGFKEVSKWWYEQMGKDDFFELAWNCFQNGVRGKIFNEVLYYYGMSHDPEIINKMINVYRNHEPDIHLFPDAEKCLYRLQPYVKLGIITDGPATSQRAKIKTLNLNKWMDLIIITSEYGEGFEKPNPIAFINIMDKLAVSPEQCIYVADNPSKDFKAPLALNWKAIRIKRENGLYSNIPLAKDDAAIKTISSLDHLEDIFQA